MGDRGFEEQDFCLPSEILTDQPFLMNKENLFKDSRNSLLPRTPLLTEPPTESLSYFSNNFLVPPFATGPKIPQKTWEMTSPTQSILSPLLGNGRALAPPPPPPRPVTPIGINIDYYQVKNINSQGQPRNFTPINSFNTLPSTNTVMWGHQQGRGHFGTGVYDVTSGMAWGGPQRRSCGGVEMRALGYGPEIKRERAGTGVFLPRRYHNTTPQSRKKSGGSGSAQPPPRVVQAKNKKFENVTPQLQAPRQFASCGPISGNELVMARKNGALAQDWRKYEMTTTTSNTTNGGANAGAAQGMNEIRLPHEWTYTY